MEGHTPVLLLLEEWKLLNSFNSMLLVEQLFSYGRLIFFERVITDRHQLQPPNNDTGDGRIECTVSGGEARFGYRGYNVPNADSQKATAVIPAGDFSNFVNIEGYCGNIYHYLFLSNGTLDPVAITGTSSTANSLTVNIGTIPDGVDRVFIGYHRLDLGQPVVGQYVNNVRGRSRTFSSLVPGAKYRITAWGLGGSSNRRRSRSPAVVEVTTRERTPSPPRDLTITRVFQHGIELNWIPPRETNGDIQHYIIQYTAQKGTEQGITTTDNTNYYILTGLERGQTYNNITVEAVNSAGTGGGSGATASYKHNPAGSTVSCPPRVPFLPPNTIILTPLTTTVPPGTTITIGCVDGYYTDQMARLTCGTDGQWTGTHTQCTETCSSDNLTAMANDISYTTPPQIRPGVVVTSHCGDGYQVAITAVCQDDRTWRVQEQCVQSQTSTNCPPTNSPPTSTAVIIAVTVVNILILLVTITLLVIGGVLIVKRKRRPSTVHNDKDSKTATTIYDEVDDRIALKSPGEDSKVYQDLDVGKMEGSSQYAAMK